MSVENFLKKRAIVLTKKEREESMLLTSQEHTGSLTNKIIDGSNYVLAIMGVNQRIFIQCLRQTSMQSLSI